MTNLVRGWFALWRWCYPDAASAIDEWADATPTGARSGAHSGWPSERRFLLSLPSLARAQAAAERNNATRDTRRPATAGTRVREAVLLTTVLGALLPAAAIAASLLFTGTFVIDAAPTIGAREVPSPYFTIALAAASTASALLLIEAIALRLVGRR